MKILGSTIKWQWNEGDYAGGVYENTFHKDGRVTWRGLEGGEAGLTATEDLFSAEEVEDNIYMISWHESIGDTVTITINLTSNTIYGVISNNSDWTVVSGEVLEFNSDF